MNFIKIVEQVLTHFTINTYYKLLDEYLQNTKKWHLQSNIDDNDYSIVNNDGTVLGKIEREYNANTKTLTLVYLASALDKNFERIKGLGLTKLIYTFEKSLLKHYDINAIEMDDVHTVTHTKFLQTYADLPIEKTTKGLRVTNK
jgi:hypothetical protein